MKAKLMVSTCTAGVCHKRFKTRRLNGPLSMLVSRFLSKPNTSNPNRRIFMKLRFQMNNLATLRTFMRMKLLTMSIYFVILEQSSKTTPHCSIQRTSACCLSNSTTKSISNVLSLKSCWIDDSQRKQNNAPLGLHLHLLQPLTSNPYKISTITVYWESQMLPRIIWQKKNITIFNLVLNWQCENKFRFRKLKNHLTSKIRNGLLLTFTSQHHASFSFNYMMHEAVNRGYSQTLFYRGGWKK